MKKLICFKELSSARTLARKVDKVMQLECEVRFLDIDLRELEERLHALGLVREYQTLFRITIFHGLSGEDREYIRVRDEGHRITMTHKRTFQDSLVAQEREVLVGSYENAIGFLEGIGAEAQAY